MRSKRYFWWYDEQPFKARENNNPSHAAPISPLHLDRHVLQRRYRCQPWTHCIGGKGNQVRGGIKPGSSFHSAIHDTGTGHTWLCLLVFTVPTAGCALRDGCSTRLCMLQIEYIDTDMMLHLDQTQTHSTRVVP